MLFRNNSYSFPLCYYYLDILQRRDFIHGPNLSQWKTSTDMKRKIPRKLYFNEQLWDKSNHVIVQKWSCFVRLAEWKRFETT
jgi:hypothetical protein